MPWKPSQATQHTKVADTRKKKKVWATVANQQLKQHGDDARAIREANAVVDRMGKAEEDMKALWKSMEHDF